MKKGKKDSHPQGIFKTTQVRLDPTEKNISGSWDSSDFKQFYSSVVGSKFPDV